MDAVERLGYQLVEEPTNDDLAGLGNIAGGMIEMTLREELHRWAVAIEERRAESRKAAVA